jgi:hypothetical protein
VELLRVDRKGKIVESLYVEGEWELYLRGPEREIRTAQEFGELSGRERNYYLRRQARRMANRIGFNGP